MITKKPWYYFLEPANIIVNTEQQRLTRLFIITLSALAPLIFIVGIVMMPLLSGAENLWDGATFWPAVSALVCSIISYILIRLDKYYFAVAVYLYIFVLAPILSISLDTSLINLPIANLAVGGVLLAVIFLPSRWGIVITGLGATLGPLLLLYLIPHLAFRDVGALVAANATNSLIILIFSYFRDLLEFYRIIDQARLDYVIESSLNEIYILDKQSLHLQYTNKGVLQNLGYSTAELRQMSPHDISPEFSENRFRNLVAPLLRHEQEIVEFETILKRKDGSLYNAEIKMQVIEHAERQQIVIFAHDTTQRKQAERALQQNREQLNQLVEHLPLAIAMFNNNMEYLQANALWSESQHHTAEQSIIGKSFYELVETVPDDLRAIHQRCLAGAIEGNERMPFQDENGELGWVRWEIRPWYSSDQFIGGILAYTEVITDRVKTELERTRLAQVVENSLNEIFIFARDTLLFQYFNRAALQNLGYSAEVLRHMTPFDIKPEFDEQSFHALLVPLVGNEQEHLIFETVHQRADSSFYDVEVRVELMEYGDTKAFVAFINDITKRKRIEEDLFAMNSELKRQSIELKTALAERDASAEERISLINDLEAKNAELERFTYTVSHDLKSPLITIGGYLGYLEQDARNGDLERLARDIAYIQQASDKMTKLLDELLELSRIGRMVNEPDILPFKEIVEDALFLVSGILDSHKINITFADDFPLVYVDRVRLVEVLQNLIDNAAKFSLSRSDPQVEIGWQDNNGTPVFYVRDNGVGIAPQYHEKIFGLFEKLDADSDGTGVGLALVKRIIEFHQGRIWLESDGQSGTTFYFTLPTKSDK